MNLTDLAEGLFGWNKCKNLVKQHGPEITVSGIGASISDIKLDVGNLSNKYKEFYTVPPVMVALDTSQYLLCKELRRDWSDQHKDLIRTMRLQLILAYTNLEVLLSIPAPTDEMNKKIVEWAEKMCQLNEECINLLKPPQIITLSASKAGNECSEPLTKGYRQSSKGWERSSDKPNAAITMARLKPIMEYQGIREEQLQEALQILNKPKLKR